MKKITGFTITKLSLSGFKCFEDDVSFDFGDTTFITASNGRGKSSMADAIAFAFVGTPFFGDRGLDRLHNRNTDEMMASVDFVDDTGEAHNLTRARKRDLTVVTYDGLSVRQSDLNAAFGDRDTFLSILNPLYFINVLGDNGKGLLEKLLPVVSHEAVLAALSEHSRDTLARQPLLSPETFIKNRRGELKALENTLIGYRSQKELTDRQREARIANLDALRAAVGTAAAEIAALAGIRDDGRDLAAEEAALAALRKRRAEWLSDAARGGADKDTQAVMGDIRALETAIAKQEAKPYASPYAARIAQAEAELKALHDEHGRVSAALVNTAVGYTCPTCAAVITAENIDAVKADLRLRLDHLIGDGRTAKNTLTELKAQDSAAAREFEAQKAASLAAERGKLAALNQQIHEFNVARELDAEDYGERLTAIDNQIAEQERRLADGHLSPEQVSRLAELERTKKEYAAKIEALSGVADDDYTPLIAETEAEIAVLKNLINEAIYYLAKRIELMLDGLKMSNTEIVLTEVVKTTGEVKDCFRFSYDGRDYRCLSLSEKVRAGLDISTLIGRLSGKNYPVFVDNGESICTFGNVQLSGQVIIARVVNNQELQVTTRRREPPRTAA